MLSKFFRVLISHDNGKTWGIRISKLDTRADAEDAKRILEDLEPSVIDHDATYKVVSVTEVTE